MSLYVPCYRPYNKHNTNIHAPGGMRTHNPSKKAAEDPRLRPRGHCDQHEYMLQEDIQATCVKQNVRNSPVYHSR
jgi:hypothetical protein